jgi:SEC-C motif domain protein
MARRRERGCPCGLPATYDACCGRFHRGEAAPSAELLMRSRYTAFVRGDAEHLMATWHATTRPPGIGFEPGLRWTGLQVLEAEGGLLDTVGTVRYRARFVRGGVPGALEEHSRFRRDGGRWTYVGPVQS